MFIGHFPNLLSARQLLFGITKIEFYRNSELLLHVVKGRFIGKRSDQDKQIWEVTDVNVMGNVTISR